MHKLSLYNLEGDEDWNKAVSVTAIFLSVRTSGVHLPSSNSFVKAGYTHGHSCPAVEWAVGIIVIMTNSTTIAIPLRSRAPK